MFLMKSTPLSEIPLTGSAGAVAAIAIGNVPRFWAAAIGSEIPLTGLWCGSRHGHRQRTEALGRSNRTGHIPNGLDWRSDRSDNRCGCRQGFRRYGACGLRNPTPELHRNLLVRLWEPLRVSSAGAACAGEKRLPSDAGCTTGRAAASRLVPSPDISLTLRKPPSPSGALTPPPSSRCAPFSSSKSFAMPGCSFSETAPPDPLPPLLTASNAGYATVGIAAA